MRFLISKKVLTLIGIVGVISFFSAATFFYFHTPTSEARFAEQAAKVIEVCKDESYKPACYDTEIPKVMDRGFSFEDAFKVTALIQNQDSSYWYCHVLGHNLSAKEAAKDVSKWTEVVARAPNGMCSNGSLHGAFQERFRGEYVSEEQLEELIPEIKSICEVKAGNRDFTGLEQASCYHALGHLSMYITNADAPESIQLCDRVSIEGEKDFSSLCYDGAFMQIFQPLEPEDIALVQDIEPKTQEESVAFCSQFEGKKRASCLTESWPLFIDDIDDDPRLVENFCSSDFEGFNKTRCLSAIFYVSAARTNFDTENITQMCSVLSGDIKAQCFANSASRFLETDYRLAQKAVNICDSAGKEGVGETCFQELLFYSGYNYHVGSEPFLRLCNALPSPWKESCLNTGKSPVRAPFYAGD
ncbi:MAG: hypothetical protein JKX80_02935 [Candidatus Pacebacteria bacterium]|nr:hypothetical protein [Candidatus Paceibacterota bacterium]